MRVAQSAKLMGGAYVFVYGVFHYFSELSYIQPSLAHMHLHEMRLLTINAKHEAHY